MLVTLFFAYCAAAQSLGLSWKEGPISNGQTLDVSVHVNSMVEVGVYVQNTSSQPVEFKVRKQDVYLVSGAHDTYCLGGNCFPGNVPVTPSSVALAPMESDSSFTGDYYPSGNEGVSVIRYTFFNADNQDDTVSVTIRYSGALGLTQTDDPARILSNPYPNPASDRVFFDYENNPTGVQRQIIIRDMTGRVVREVIIPSGQGVLEVDLSGIDSGIHFYTLLDGQRVVFTRKLIVKR